VVEDDEDEDDNNGEGVYYEVRRDICDDNE
jgi:hypothetical protein